MNRVCAVLVGLLVTVSPTRAQGPDESYVRIYNLIQQAEGLQASGSAEEALSKYSEANQALQQIKRVYPKWQTTVVDYRLRYLAAKIEKLGGSTARAAAGTTASSGAATPDTPTSAASNAASRQELKRLESALTQLQADKQLLEAKLKEALGTRPAPLDPVELARAQERIQSLLKENELLRTGLEQAEQRPEVVAAKELEETRRRLAAANTSLEEQRAANQKLASERTALLARVESLGASAATASALRAENELLKKQLVETQSLAASASTAAATAATAAQRLTQAEARIASLQSDAQVLQLEKLALESRLNHALTNVQAKSQTVTSETDKARIAELERQRDFYMKRLEKAMFGATAGEAGELSATVDRLNREVTSLQSRLEVFEAKAIPYTAEELALFERPSVAPAPASPPREPLASRQTDAADASVNTATLMIEASRLFANQQYEQAEDRYLTILRQNENNAQSHANLAAIQLELGSLNEAEKHLNRALEIDPDHAQAVSLLGHLKYRQEKYDEAIEVLNRAAKLNPKDPSVQNLLGVTLSEKGLRGPAEQAFRRAIILDGNHANAHHNLAVFYSLENPPNIPLARFHYLKARSAGHPVDPEVEALLERPAGNANRP